MLNGIAVVALVVTLGVLGFSLTAFNSYYSSVLTGLENKAQTASEFFTNYVSKTYLEYYQSAYRYTESFEDKDSLELQFINTRGRVEISSYGLTAGSRPGTPDIDGAMTEGKISHWRGVDVNTGERVMSVSAPIRYVDGSIIGVMRYVTSLKLVDEQIKRTTLIAVAVGLVVILMILLSNLYFIKTITVPIHDLTGLAKKISEGSYGIQAEKQYDDEIGELTDAINDMSSKINRSEKMQTEFISSVSHELRTPLTAITGWSETLMYDENISEDSLRGLEIISKEAGRLTKMVEELLEFTRIQDGRFNLDIELVDVEEELEDIVFAYTDLFKQEGISLRYYPPEEILQPIPADPERLRQVFLNILDNASKYGKSGEFVDVSLVSKGEFLIITVRDYGPGIPPSEIQFVKNKFYKGSSKERGSGIGLAVCDEIVTRHGGELLIENAPDKGVAVTAKFPINPTKTPNNPNKKVS